MVGSDRVFGAFGSIGCRGSAGGLAPFVSKEREHGVPEVQTSRGGGGGGVRFPRVIFRVRTTRRYMSNNQTLRPACTKPVESKIMEDRIGGS